MIDIYWLMNFLQVFLKNRGRLFGFETTQSAMSILDACFAWKIVNYPYLSIYLGTIHILSELQIITE